MKAEDITAWALNELSPEERAQIEAELQGSLELQEKAADTKAFCALLNEHLGSGAAEGLTDQQRQALLAAAPRNVVAFAANSETASDSPSLATQKRAAPASHLYWTVRAVIGLAACLAFSALVMQQMGLTGGGRSEDVAQQQAQPVAARQAGKPASESISIVAAETAKNQPKLFESKPTMSVVGQDAAGILPGEPAPGAKIVPLAKADASGGLAAPGNLEVGVGLKMASPAPADEALIASANTGNLSTTVPAARAAVAAPSPAKIAVPMQAPAPRPVGPVVGDKIALAAGREVAGAGDVKAETKRLRSQMAELRGRGSEGETGKDAAGRGLSFGNAAIAPDRPAPYADAFVAPDTHSRTNTERYIAIHENAFRDVGREPLSTFSIDVDTASYANVRRFLNQGSLPPADAVRLEELINYFPYAYDAPAKKAAQPFSVQVDLAEAPWAPELRLARIGIKGKEVGLERVPANFVFLVDVSGSMSDANKLPLVKRSLIMLAEQLREDDRVAIVTYAGSSGVALESTPGKDRPRIVAAIEALQSGGSTNGASGIELAYAEAQKHFIKEGVNRVILCTDGDFNVGISSPEELEKLIKRKAQGGVFLSVLGYGQGNLQDRTMETLADKGNGNYAYIDSLSEARKVLVEQMHGTLVTIAKDVKIQVEFNPAVVRAYRLLGYENRVLANEDFNNDRKDAGEIGAGHSVTALYEIVPVDAPIPIGRPIVDDLKYQPRARGEKELPAMAAKAPLEKLEGFNDEVMTVKLRYKAPDGNVSELTEVPVKDRQTKLQDAPRDFQFAAAVAGFGLLLRDSEHKGSLTWDEVRKLAIAGKGEDLLGYRGEFIQLIDKANGLMGRP